MSHARRSLWIASGLFIVSGLTALTYETIWFKRLGHVWGSSSQAMACVVATFLCGLGLGAWWFGRIADRSSKPLALYGWCELGIAGAALLVPFEIGWLLERAAGLSVSLAGSPWAQTALRFSLTFAAIGPACVLMGATLPLLTREFATRGLSVGASAAWLYAFNTLGAACGAWLAGFVLLEAFGLVWTNVLAATLNTLVGIGALLLARERNDAPEAEAELPETLERVAPRAVAAVAFAAGAASIALQMLWAREISLLVGATTYAFSATIFVFILGLGLGSLWFRLAFANARRLEPVIALAATLVVLPALAGLALRGEIGLIVGHLQDMRHDGTLNAVLCSTVGAALEFLPTVGMGLLFPALVQFARQGSGRAGRVVGGIYAWNTLGSIVGAGATGLALVPMLGSFWSFRAALLVYALTPIVLLGARNLAATTSIVCAVALLSNWKAPDPLDTNLGTFMYGPEATKITRGSMRTLYFGEGATSNVLVMEGTPAASPLPGRAPERVLTLRVNGKIDASSRDDMPMQLGLAYIPRFLRPSAKSVLVIGMGSGATAGASALFPEAQVTCCEIEPEIIAAVTCFSDFNHRPLEAPNVAVVLDDGRSFVQGSAGPWDLILSEPSNPWIAGVANLFTEEFYRSAQSKLSRDGILVQWLQAYSFSEREYALVIRTLTRVFGRCLLVRISDYDTLLVVGNGDLLPRAAALDELQRRVDTLQPAHDDLERYFGTSDIRTLLLGRVLLDERGVQQFVASVGGDELNTDLNLRLEFDAPRRLFHERGDPGAETMRLMCAAYDVALLQRMCTQWRVDARQLAGLKQLKTLLFQNLNNAQATNVVDLALAYDSEDAELLTDQLLFAPEVAPDEFLEITRRITARAPLEALRLGLSLTRLNQDVAARMVFEHLTVAHPNSVTAWTQYSIALKLLRQDSEAVIALDKARSLDPLDDAFRPR